MPQTWKVHFWKKAHPPNQQQHSHFLCSLCFTVASLNSIQVWNTINGTHKYKPHVCTRTSRLRVRGKWWRNKLIKEGYDQHHKCILSALMVIWKPFPTSLQLAHKIPLILIYTLSKISNTVDFPFFLYLPHSHFLYSMGRSEKSLLNSPVTIVIFALGKREHSCLERKNHTCELQIPFPCMCQYH